MARSFSIDDILPYFEELDWPLQEVDRETGRIFTSYRGYNVLLDMEVGLNLEWQLLQLTLILPEIAPPDKIAETLAVMNRINYNLALGHFEIGAEDRQLAYYVSVPLAGLGDLRTAFETLISWAVDIVDQEHPKLMRAIYADPGAEESLADGMEAPPRRFDA